MNATSLGTSEQHDKNFLTFEVIVIRICVMLLLFDGQLIEGCFVRNDKRSDTVDSDIAPWCESINLRKATTGQQTHFLVLRSRIGSFANDTVAQHLFDFISPVNNPSEFRY